MNAHARQSECTLEIKMSFDQQSLSGSMQRGVQPSTSDGPHQSSTQIAERGSSPSHAPLLPCVYIALLCSQCGELRQALASLPNTEVTMCPECARACAFVLLGSGFTRRVLPFHEIRPAEPIPWDGRNGEPDETDESDDDS